MHARLRHRPMDDQIISPVSATACDGHHRAGEKGHLASYRRRFPGHSPRMRATSGDPDRESEGHDRDHPGVLDEGRLGSKLNLSLPRETPQPPSISFFFARFPSPAFYARM